MNDVINDKGRLLYSKKHDIELYRNISSTS